jgi:membrane-bound lytic murein transglycosylase F
MPATAPTPRRLAWWNVLPATCLLLSACTPLEETKINAVKRSGELVVLTRNSPTTYYEGPDGPTGLEYDLARLFADQLGVPLRMKTVWRFSNLLPMLAGGEGDLAAAGISVTPARASTVRFTPPYQTIRQQVVYHTRNTPPAGVRDLAGRHLQILAGSSYAERLQQLKQSYPALSWREVNDVETEELLQQVQDGFVELTIADSNVVALSRQVNHDLRIAFDLGEPEQLAWAFPPGGDDSLYHEAVRFIERVRASGELAQLIERHYGAASRFNPINLAAYREGIHTDLPLYRDLFQEAGRRYLIDWHLLAAMSYQESYWDPRATSPTGVRGMMMLTEVTARQLGVTDRLDARQSIFGGAAYLRSLMDRIPSRIRDPDRTWMALAAYNVGLNHLEDARIITQRQGGDPDQWSDVRQRLPLLARSAWFTTVRHGYARGYEPVQFVTRIRTYYELLRKLDNDERVRRGTDALRLRAPAL